MTAFLFGLQSAIFIDDVDRDTILAALQQKLRRFNVLCHTCCLITNHSVFFAEEIYCDQNLATSLY